jgi:hypothetical protein
MDGADNRRQASSREQGSQSARGGERARRNYGCVLHLGVAQHGDFSKISNQQSEIRNPFMTDLRYALRQLAKSPGFTVVALVTLALAIGANSAVFSLINALLVRPLPYKDPAALVLLWEQFRTLGLDRIPVSAPEYAEYEKRLRSFERTAAFKYESFNLSGDGNPERIQGAVVSPSLFDLLGVQPIRGRTFAVNEGGSGRDDVVVISAGLWQRRFNSDPAVIGNKIQLNGRSYTVIGVAPPTFEFPLPLFNVQGNQFAERADIWKPVAFTEDEMKARGLRGYSIIARLRSGVSKAQAQAEIDTLRVEWERQFPDNYASGTGFGVKIYPLQEQIVGGIRKGLVILLGAVSLARQLHPALRATRADPVVALDHNA